MMRPPLAIGTALAAMAALGCGTAGFPEPEPPTAGLPPPDAVVYLVGDAGLATPDLPVIVQLGRDVAGTARASDVVVAFLGDNVYEHGLHDPSDKGYRREVESLQAQIDVVKGTGARGLFIPGNHDWGYGNERGLDQVRHQEAFVDSMAREGADVVFLPAAGCPGPDLVSAGASVLLAIIETDLWLRDPAVSWSEGCPHPSTDSAAAALEMALRENAAAGKQIVVLAHHPLKSHGRHAGYFGWKNQLFPGTNLWAPLYIPLPFLYPAVRNTGISAQDMNNSKNKAMRAQLTAAFTSVPGQPLVYGSGHDHSLQVFDGSEFGAGYLLVSGAGSRLTEVGKYDAKFASGARNGELGYMRLEFFADGRVLLSVVSDGTSGCGGPKKCAGQPTVRYREWLAGG